MNRATDPVRGRVAAGADPLLRTGGSVYFRMVASESAT
jgi:hypothetical protein